MTAEPSREGRAGGRAAGRIDGGIAAAPAGPGRVARSGGTAWSVLFGSF
ncbi:hypothetical protein [Myceligenerans crystallogenes]